MWNELCRDLYHHLTDCFVPANTNLARNKPATQSSDWSPDYVARNAVDGNTYTFSKTGEQNNPYWSVDLGVSCYIDDLYITNVIKNGELFPVFEYHFYCIT